MKKNDSRQKFIDTARTLFADHGYYGVSLADVADELGLTKQSVIYHFKTKEALYRAVLEQLAARFDALSCRMRSDFSTNRNYTKGFLIAVHNYLQAEPADARLIARELLDNINRAETSRIWYLRPFLDNAVETLKLDANWTHSTEVERSIALYQMIGAISCFAISQPTLEGVWGKERLDAMNDGFLDALLANCASGETANSTETAIQLKKA